MDLDGPAGSADADGKGPPLGGSRGKFRPMVTEYLTAWFLRHADHPYPEPGELAIMALVTGLKLEQIYRWYTNMRKRHWMPIKKRGEAPRNFLQFMLKEGHAPPRDQGVRINGRMDEMIRTEDDAGWAVISLHFVPLEILKRVKLDSDPLYDESKERRQAWARRLAAAQGTAGAPVNHQEATALGLRLLREEMSKREREEEAGEGEARHAKRARGDKENGGSERGGEAEASPGESQISQGDDVAAPAAAPRDEGSGSDTGREEGRGDMSVAAPVASETEAGRETRAPPSLRVSRKRQQPHRSPLSTPPPVGAMRVASFPTISPPPAQNCDAPSDQDAKAGKAKSGGGPGRAQSEDASTLLQVDTTALVAQDAKGGATGPSSDEISPPAGPDRPSPKAIESLRMLMPSMDSHPQHSRRFLPSGAVEHLKDWICTPEHIYHPYPTEAEKAHLAARSGLSIGQVGRWFMNTRKRVWRPWRNQLTGKPAPRGRDLEGIAASVLLGFGKD